MFIDHWRFRHKITLILGLSLAGMVLLVAAGLTHLHDETMEGRRLQTRRIVEVATSLVDHYVEQANAGLMMEDDAKEAAIQALRALRYGDDAYFWINDMAARVVMDPVRQDLAGKDMSAVVDGNGKAIFTAFVQAVAKEGAGFVDYLWPKPGFEQPVAKIAYVKGIESWGWVVGSGIYVDDVEAAFRAEILTQGIRVTLIVVLVLGVSIGVGRGMARPMAAITRTMHRLAEGDTAAVADGVGRRDEICDMALSVGVLRDNA